MLLHLSQHNLRWKSVRCSKTLLTGTTMAINCPPPTDTTSGFVTFEFINPNFATSTCTRTFWHPVRDNYLFACEIVISWIADLWHFNVWPGPASSTYTMLRFCSICQWGIWGPLIQNKWKMMGVDFVGLPRNLIPLPHSPGHLTINGIFLLINGHSTLLGLFRTWALWWSFFSPYPSRFLNVVPEETTV